MTRSAKSPKINRSDAQSLETAEPLVLPPSLPISQNKVSEGDSFELKGAQPSAKAKAAFRVGLSSPRRLDEGKKHTSAIMSVRVPKPGQLLAVDVNGNMRRWDVSTGKIAGEVLRAQDRVIASATGPEGEVLFSTMFGNVLGWPSENETLQPRFKANLMGLAPLSPDHLLGWTMAGYLAGWDRKDDAWAPSETVYGPSLWHDGRDLTAIASCGTGVCFGTEGGALGLVSVNAPNEALVLPVGSAQVTCLAPIGQDHVAVGFANGQASIVSLSSFALLREAGEDKDKQRALGRLVVQSTFAAHSSKVNGIAVVERDGCPLVATGSEGGTLRLWSLKGKKVAERRVHASIRTIGAPAPDCLVVGCREGGLKKLLVKSL